MKAEIEFVGPRLLKVRRATPGPVQLWEEFGPGQRDTYLTGMTYEELRGLGEGRHDINENPKGTAH